MLDLTKLLDTCRTRYRVFRTLDLIKLSDRSCVDNRSVSTRALGLDEVLPRKICLTEVALLTVGLNLAQSCSLYTRSYIDG